MNELMQLMLTTAIVAVAGAYVIRRAWRLVRGRSGATCGGCGKCSAATIVPIESLRQSQK